MIAGGVGYFASVILLTWCSKYWHFLLDFGVLMGISTALLTMPAISALGQWFKRQRGIATGVAFMGSSIGGIVFPIVLQQSLFNKGWSWTMHTVSFIVFILLALGIPLVRGRLPPGEGRVDINLKAFKDFRFVCATTGVACEYIPIPHNIFKLQDTNLVIYKKALNSPCMEFLVSYQHGLPTKDSAPKRVLI